jgi:hypothetical protein
MKNDQAKQLLPIAKLHRIALFWNVCIESEEQMDVRWVGPNLVCTINHLTGRGKKWIED